MTFSLSQHSLDKLSTVHNDLQSVVKKAITISTIDFCVLEGLRTLEREREMVAEGKSQTMNSRHLSGLAVDLGAMINGVITWESKYYDQVSNAMLQSAAALNIPIVWGGSWITLKDLDHFELNRAYYKDAVPQ